MWADMIAGTPAAMAARKGASSIRSMRSRSAAKVFA